MLMRSFFMFDKANPISLCKLNNNNKCVQYSVTYVKLKSIITNLNNKKCPSEDGITNKIIKVVFFYYSNLLLFKIVRITNISSKLEMC